MLQTWNTLAVAARKTEAEDIASFELVDPHGGLLPPFTAGSHVDVEIVPGLVRQYSLCNDPRERHRYLIGVLREPKSRGGSATLIESVETGALLAVGAPRNHFALDPSAGRVLLLAGGIGITPILCMAERLSQTTTPFDLHYCTRGRQRTAFLDRILRSSFADRALFHFDDEAALNPLDLYGILARPEPADHLYVCGPRGFIDAVLSAAANSGWRPERLHREFFSADAELPRSSDRTFEVEIASSGARFPVVAGRPVTDALAAAGIDIPVSCEQGVCGTCLTGVLHGIPDHRDMFMTDAEHARNDRFTPCCSRAISDLLVLDL